jgi:protein-L-isoaspartate(D-aspartate) O-methyltransferase
MASLDERARPFRASMVDEIGRHGVTDGRVLDAMRRVPRHRFVDRFIGGPLDGRAWTLETMRELVMDEDADDETLALTHEAARALPASGSTGMSITTSVSAPQLVASMLQQLDVAPGMRVLEIGAGSGYNAALLAELGGTVTSIDIDASLIEPARTRLRALGCDDVVVLEGDGDLGVPDRAPFDRIIATVGCNDLSPEWFAQLAPDGRMLVPVFHGAGHPLVEAEVDGTSRLVGPSGFVPVQGRQAELGWWQPQRAFPTLGPTWELSPRQLAAAALYVALRDRTMTNTDLVDDWDALGRPSIDRYTATWTPPPGDGGDSESLTGPWRIPRIHHDEVVTLTPG